MIAQIKSIGLIGLSGFSVTVETDITPEDRIIFEIRSESPFLRNALSDCRIEIVSPERI